EGPGGGAGAAGGGPRGRGSGGGELIVAHWGGAAGGWSNTGQPSMQRPSSLKRSVDGWDDDELGRVYDHSVMRRLFPYLRPYKRQAVLATAGMLIAAVASNAQPFL